MAASRLDDATGNGDAGRNTQGDLEALRPVVRIGVTGHRDVADPQVAGDVAGAALCRVLALLESARLPVSMFWSVAPAAGTLGYRVVSPLAEGADRVVAGLACPDAGSSGRTRELVAPLPFPVDDYRGRNGHPGTNCKTLASQREFDDLARGALWVRPLHARAPKNQQQRNDWYRDVGEYVVEHCDVLFALWDGSDNEKRGGTADIVRFALQRGTPVVWIPVSRRGQQQAATPPLPEPGPWLLTAPAVGEVDLAAAIRACVDLSAPQAQTVLLGRRRPRRSAQELLLERLARLEELNRYAASKGARQDIVAEMRDAVAAEPDNLALARVARWITPSYAIADGLARRYQWRLKALNIGVYAAAAVAVVLGALAAIIFPHGGYWQLLVICEAAVLAGLLAVQWLSLRRKCRDRWVAFRAMGEYFRIGRYLALVTPERATGLEFGRFVRLYSWSSEPGFTAWFAPVVERAWDRRPDPGPNSDDVAWLRDYLVTDWIEDQIAYHERRRDDHQLWDSIFQWAIRITLFATILIVILHVLRDYFPAFLGTPHAGRDMISLTLAFLAIALTSVAAALNGYAGQQRHRFHYARFRRMAAELRQTKASLPGVTDIGQLRDRIADVRRVTLGETTNWFEDMQEQAMDSPA